MTEKTHPGGTILIVDDMPMNLELLEAMLKKAGYISGMARSERYLSCYVKDLP